MGKGSLPTYLETTGRLRESHPHPLWEEILKQIEDDALITLNSLNISLNPPYHVNIEGTDWEFCIVLSSERFSSEILERTLLFTPTTNVVPIQILNHRALLARKRRRSKTGSRIMLGRALIRPWLKVLKERGIIPGCLTSRTLGRLMQVTEAFEA